ncbi:MAG: hypothetical protein DHS20C11_14890 [Lysobacteraceae bacterium]|nr:MAG: hypothetical protein DHS20C11_14890 [Xanthomonadaceae bacterium]
MIYDGPYRDDALTSPELLGLWGHRQTAVILVAGVVPSGDAQLEAGDSMRTRIFFGLLFLSGALVAQTEVKLTASDAAANDVFGSSVALSNNTVLVGASGDGNTGSAYVFMRDQGGIDMWGQVIRITASDAASGDSFGAAVAIDGDIAVVGNFTDADMGTDTGSAYVFSRNQGGANMWGQVTKLTASDAAMNDRFGASVSIHGDTVAVGADQDSYDAIIQGGAVYVYYRNQGGADMWGQVRKVTPGDGDSNDGFGTAVSIDADSIVVGAPFSNPGSAVFGGSAYVFLRNQGGSDMWGQIAKLVSSDVAGFDLFGGAVSIDGDTSVVGAISNTEGGIQGGSAYVFSRNQGGAENWGQVAKMTATDAANGDNLGISVATSGDTALVGAYLDVGGGSAYLFSRDQGGADMWGQVTRFAGMDTSGSDQFGRTVSVDGGTAVIGAPLNGDAGTNSGSAYVLFGAPVPVELQRFSVD